MNTSPSPSSATRQALEALGARLRQVRLSATPRLSGRALAGATGQHFTRVSKIEHGVQPPTEDDIRAWCQACGAQDEIPDLLAELRSVNSSYMEFWKASRAGMKRVVSLAPDYDATALFRIYEHNVIPGLFQTPEYTRSMIEFWVDFLDTPRDIDEAVAAMTKRQGVLTRVGKRFSVVLEEQALKTWFGSASVQREQLQRLLQLMSLPTVSVGIIPLMKPRFGVPQSGFWMFDNDIVCLETPTASISVTRPSEVALYARMFDLLKGTALHGPAARDLIRQAIAEIV